MVKRREKTGRRRLALRELSNLLSEQSLADWSSFSEDMRRKIGLEREDLCAVFTFEPLYTLHLRVPRLLKNCLTQYLSPENAQRHSSDPYKKQR